MSPMIALTAALFNGRVFSPDRVTSTSCPVNYGCSGNFEAYRTQTIRMRPFVYIQRNMLCRKLTTTTYLTSRVFPKACGSFLTLLTRPQSVAISESQF